MMNEFQAPFKVTIEFPKAVLGWMQHSLFEGQLFKSTAIAHNGNALMYEPDVPNIAGESFQFQDSVDAENFVKSVQATFSKVAKHIANQEPYRIEFCQVLRGSVGEWPPTEGITVHPITSR